jgi:adenylate cyclase
VVRDRSSTLAYKGQPTDSKRIGLDLGVRYLVEGSVQKEGERVRISVALIDATTGICLWGDRFDGSLLEAFDLQTKVAIGVAGIVEPTLQAVELQRMARRPTSDLTAYDLYLRGYAMMSSAKLIPEALTLLEEAIARDPCYGPALACAALCHFRLTYDGRSRDPDADRAKSTDLARRALEVAGDNSAVLVNAALALAGLGEDLDEMMRFVEHALDLNPAFARGWYVSSNLKIWLGELDAAIEHAESSIHLSPRDRVGASQCVIGAAHFYSRRFSEAVPKFRIAIAEDPSFPQAYRFLAACYAYLGRMDEARAVMERLRAMTAEPIAVSWGLRSEEHKQLFLTGMQLASGEQH